MAFFSFPERVNEYAARTVAASVATLLVLGFVFDVPAVPPLVAAGFLLRVAWGPRFSPLARVASAFAASRWKVKPVFGPPKRFAQGIGAVITLAATVLWLADQPTAAWVVAGVVVICAEMEAAIPFCLGCWAYGLLQEAGVFQPEVCTDCAPAGRELKPF